MSGYSLSGHFLSGLGASPRLLALAGNFGCHQTVVERALRDA